jgi:hypothetical protein
MFNESPTDPYYQLYFMSFQLHLVSVPFLLAHYLSKHDIIYVQWIAY